ncbi:MAG: T9SS type A sorting domain-containing protein [Ignavibacterium sp.]|nr:T9SS type A sorting domain-containing protein [Ignavibacterium sp.]
MGLFLRYNDTTYIPVELMSFIASVKNDNVLLEWITASEINNYGFEIQRNLDNKSWEEIGFIPGKGTTTNKSYYSFIDNNTIDEKISYRLKQIDYNGEFKFSFVIKVDVKQPLHFSLLQNFPNPFNPKTKISFEIPFQSDVKIVLYDITGKELKTLINQHLKGGFYTIPLVAKDLSSGIYFYRMTSSSGYTAVKKLTIIK